VSNLNEQAVVKQKKDCYSYHNFQFPFRWSSNNNQTKKNSFDVLNVKLVEPNLWERKPFKLDNILAYNEYRYFYSFVRDVIYDRADETDQIQCKHYELGISDKAEYQITLKDKIYVLEIESITLDLYELNAGILSFHLFNRKKEQSTPLSILKINQYGRRIYLPFFKTEKEDVATAKIFNAADFAKGLDGSKGIEIAHKIALVNLFEENDDIIVEDFSKYNSPANFENGDFPTPKLISGLLEPILVDFTIEQLLDDRMFVLCWYGNNGIGNRLAYKYSYKNDKWWFKYIYVDARLATCQNSEMRNHFIENSTNARWADFRTFFGATRYSFVLLTNELSTLKKDKAEFILNHIQTIYFQMTRMVLLQRVLLLNFSQEINKVSKLKLNEGLIEKVDLLYENYLTFINKIHFKEITAQDQGIELYDMLIDKMRVNRDVDYLSKEMQELHSYVNLKQQKQQNDESSKLTKIATIFIVPTFVISLLSLIAGQKIDFQASFEWEMLGYVLFLVVIALISIFYVRKRPSKVITWIIKYIDKI